MFQIVINNGGQHYLNYQILTCASSPGLTKSTCDMKNFNHVTAMADYALRLRDQLENVNEHSFNNFKIRIGLFEYSCSISYYYWQFF